MGKIVQFAFVGQTYTLFGLADERFGVSQSPHLTLISPNPGLAEILHIKLHMMSKNNIKRH